MNVLVVNPLVDPVTGGGMAQKSVTIVRALRARGMTCTYLTTNVDMSATRPAAVADLDVTVLPALFARFNVPLPSGLVRHTVADLVGTADVLLLLNHWTLLNAIAYRAARRAQKPFVLLPGGALPAHGRSHHIKNLYHAAIGRRMIAEAAAIIATTGLEADDLVSSGIRAERVRIIPNAIADEPDASADPAAFRARHGLGDAPFVLFVGRLHTVKGPDLLVDAFGRLASRLPSMHLVLAGSDDGLRASLEQRIAALGLGTRVHLAGHLDRHETTAAYRAATVQAVPSRKEAMSLVALEAGMLGVPLLLTDTCGFSEVQTIGGGCVVAPSVDSLEVGLWELLRDREAEPDRLPAMGRRLQAFVKEHHTWARIAPLYEGVLRQAAERGQPAGGEDVAGRRVGG
jgi:glycosyltransferase involved in cell wall biosynthesis